MRRSTQLIFAKHILLTVLSIAMLVLWFALYCLWSITYEMEDPYFIAVSVSLITSCIASFGSMILFDAIKILEYDFNKVIQEAKKEEKEKPPIKTPKL